MLVCNVSLRPPRRAIAADIAEVVSAADATATGNIVFATLVDDPANVLDILDAYSGEIMLEAASAGDSFDAGLSYNAAIDESISAIDAPAGTVTAAPTSWEPSALGADLRAWYKFNTLTGSNGDFIGSVTDASGNGFNLTQTGFNRPNLAVAEQNGLNTLRFDFAGTAFAKFYPLANSILSGGAAGSVYIIYKVDSESVNNVLMDWGNSGNQSHWPYLDGVFYIDFGSTVRKAVGNPTVAMTTYRIFSIYSAASDWAFYIDGGSGGSSGGTSPFFSTASNTVGWTAAGVNLGANSATALTGAVAEVFFTSAKQSTSDRQKAEGYLAHKWGLTGNLDSSHPYKTTPP